MIRGGIVIPKIEKSDLDAIRAQSDIVDVISSYLPLDKKGKDYVGICPFHDDHDPSMRVSPQKQIFKCFVCGQGGDVFGFLSKIENIPFYDAVSLAASRIHYPLQYTKAAPKADPHQQAYDALNQFVEYCNYNLYSADGANALAYLRSRKFSDEVISKYKIGYAPNASKIQRFFKAKNISPKTLLEAGLIVDNDSLDQPMFYDRIIIPIQSSHDKTIGITARTLSKDKNTPKYLNTGNTPIFEKGQILFNYPLARKAARKSGRLILCEGAMDVLGLAKAGMEEGLAAMGTAMTDQQLGLIARLQVPVTVFYDSDRAGQNAAYKFGMQALNARIPFSIVSKTDLKDPDDIFIEKGAEFLKNVVSRTISFVDFCFDYLKNQYDLQNYEDRKEYAAAMADLIKKAASDFEASAYYQRLEELTGFDYSSQQRIPFSSSQKGRKKRPAVSISVPSIPPGRQKAERNILCAMLYGYGFVEAFKDEIGFFSDPLCQELSLYVYEAYRHNEQIDPLGLLDAIQEEDLRNLLVELFSLDSSRIANEQYFYDAVLKIKESALNEQIDQVSSQIRNCPDMKESIRLAVKKRELIQAKNQLRLRKED